MICGFLKEKAAHILRAVLLFLLMIPFGTEFFIFQEYNIFYDIRTILNGAGGAATGFLDEIARLVFSFSGISLILLLAVPAVLYLLTGKRLLRTERPRMSRRQILCTLAASVILFAAGIGTTRLSRTFADAYDTEYSFPSAVENFGLLTALRLDVGRGDENREIDFELTAPETTPKPIETEPPQTTAPQDDAEEAVTETTAVTYGKNVSDIDFAALAEQDSGTLRALSEYVASLEPSSKNEYTGLFEGKNLIFITAEAFSREAIRKDLTPTLYRLYTKGIRLRDYSQPSGAGTTGGEFQNIFGLLPMKGGASFPSFTRGGNIALTMSAQLDSLGYWGKAYHNNDCTFYARNVTHNRLGFSEGFMGRGSGMEQYVKYEWPESDLDMMEGTVAEYIDKPHFNVYYMSVSGHSAYGRYGNAMSKKNWSKVEDMDYSDTVKAYFAANIELDKGVAALLKALEKKGIADDTVIVISPDHFPYGLDDNASFGRMHYLSELYGYNVENALQRDHNAAIIWCGALEGEKQISVKAPTSSLDLLPTLSNLFGLEFDSRLMPGRDVFSDAEAIYFDRDYNWKTERGYYLASARKFYPERKDDEVPEEYVERIKAIVRNKVSFCQGVLNTNYYAHVLGTPEE